MRAPNKIYVEVCEDGIFAFPEPPFKESVEYIRADLVEGIKGNLEEIPSNVSIEEEPEKQTSEYFKKPDYDKQVVKKMSEELAKIITDQIAEPVDLENEAVAFCFDNGINVTPYQATRIARHFYELGRKGGRE